MPDSSRSCQSGAPEGTQGQGHCRFCRLSSVSVLQLLQQVTADLIGLLEAKACVSGVDSFWRLLEEQVFLPFPVS